MKLTVVLNVATESRGLAEAVHRALKPDDADVPEGIKLRSGVEDSSVIYELSAEFEDTSKLYTLCNVVDDILAHLALALNVTCITR